MYPFRILLVRKDNYVLMRVVYQQHRKIDDHRINTRNIFISSAACPEWAVRDEDPAIYLRGYVYQRDHEARVIGYEKPTDELIEKINNDLKLIYEEINRLNQLSYAS